MSRSGPSLPSTGPVLSDVARLWSHLTTEYVTDLAITLEPGMNTDGTPRITMSLESPRFGNVPGGAYVHIWAKRVFSGVDYKGSYNQLYDLLIVGHRSMEREFAGLGLLPADKAD